MVRINRTTTAVLIVCMFAQCTPLFAADEARATPPAPATPLTFNGARLDTLGSIVTAPAPTLDRALDASTFDASTFAQFRGRGRRGRGGRNDGAAAALFLGAIGTIAGSALLIYANRPECSVSAQNTGCGYGTKVAGGAVLSAGLVGLLIGAATWR